MWISRILDWICLPYYLCLSLTRFFYQLLIRYCCLFASYYFYSVYKKGLFLYFLYPPTLTEDFSGVLSSEFPGFSKLLIDGKLTRYSYISVINWSACLLYWLIFIIFSLLALILLFICSLFFFISISWAMSNSFNFFFDYYTCLYIFICCSCLRRDSYLR